MFIDDLKVYEESPRLLEHTMKKVDNVSGALGMSLGLEKCAVAHVQGGEMVRYGPLGLKPGKCVCELGDSDTYRYLGVSQLLTADKHKTKREVKREFKKRERKVWGSGICARQARMAHNAWAVPVCSYFFAAVE